MPLPGDMSFTHGVWRQMTATDKTLTGTDNCLPLGARDKSQSALFRVSMGPKVQPLPDITSPPSLGD